MKQLLRRRPSPGAVVAVVAVVLASAGSATAARVITGKQIKNSSITSADVKNRSLLGGDFKPGELPAGARGPQGATGAQGPPGTPGAPGAPGFGLLRYPQTVTNFSNGESDQIGTPCPAGTFPTGGSAWAVDTATETVDHPEVITSEGIVFDPSGPDGYFAVVNDLSSGNVSVVVDVACANATLVLPSSARKRTFHR